MAAKSLDAKDITITNNGGLVVTPFDCSTGAYDDDDLYNSSGGDHVDDGDGCF
jgi:hypothetical protein